MPEFWFEIILAFFFGGAVVAWGIHLYARWMIRRLESESS